MNESSLKVLLGCWDILVGWLYPPRIHDSPRTDERILLRLVLYLYLIILSTVFLGPRDLWVDNRTFQVEPNIINTNHYGLFSSWENAYIYGFLILLGWAIFTGVMVFLTWAFDHWPSGSDLLRILLIPIYWTGWLLLLPWVLAATGHYETILVGIVQLLLLGGYGLWQLCSYFTHRLSLPFGTALFVSLLVLTFPGWVAWVPFPIESGLTWNYGPPLPIWEIQTVTLFLLALTGYLLVTSPILYWFQKQDLLPPGLSRSWTCSTALALMLPGLLSLGLFLSWSYIPTLMNPPQVEPPDWPSPEMEDRAQYVDQHEKIDQTFERHHLYDSDTEQVTDTGLNHSDELTQQLSSLADFSPANFSNIEKEDYQGDTIPQAKVSMSWIKYSDYFANVANRKQNNNKPVKATQILQDLFSVGQDGIMGEAHLLGKLIAAPIKDNALDQMFEFYQTDLGQSHLANLRQFLIQKWQPIDPELMWSGEAKAIFYQITYANWKVQTGWFAVLFPNLKKKLAYQRAYKRYYSRVITAHKQGQKLPKKPFPPREINLAHFIMNHPQSPLLEILYSMISIDYSFNKNLKDIRQMQFKHLCLIRTLSERLDEPVPKLKLRHQTMPDSSCVKNWRSD